MCKAGFGSPVRLLQSSARHAGARRMLPSRANVRVRARASRAAAATLNV
jgi:hypothetical protein